MFEVNRDHLNCWQKLLEILKEVPNFLSESLCPCLSGPKLAIPNLIGGRCWGAHLAQGGMSSRISKVLCGSGEKKRCGEYIHELVLTYDQHAWQRLPHCS